MNSRAENNPDKIYPVGTKNIYEFKATESELKDKN